MRGAAPPVALTIAGSDPGGGAGIQGDLKTFAAHDVYGLSVITAVTAQNTREVRASFTLPHALVEEQLRALQDDFEVAAVKTGMLADAGIVRVVARFMDAMGTTPLVIDPVLRSSSGAPLLDEDGLQSMRADLLPRATLVTPNRQEALRLAGGKSADVRAAVAGMVGDGVRAILVTGGDDDPDSGAVTDLFWDGVSLHELRQRRVRTSSTHGTGCALSAAVAARLARGEELAPAVRGAREWLLGALAAARPLGGGRGPVHHLYRKEAFQ